MKRTFFWLSMICCFAGINSSSWACNIPVFRYALENWQPDPYSVFILHQGDLTKEQESLLSALQSKSLENQAICNANVFVVDTRKLSADTNSNLELPLGTVDYLRRWLEHTSSDSPTIVTLFPDHPPQALPAWHSDFNATNLRTLFDSPLRRELAQRILDGQSAVWVLVESGNAEADDAAFRQLEKLLIDAPEHVSLPDQDLIETDEEYNPDNEIELKVEFSAIRVSREASDEAAIVSMLLGSEEDLREFDEPIAIPVYGRGRTYYALIGKGINADTVNDNCQFMCGACSCQIKQDNPGIDLMLAMDWQNLITESAMEDIPLPELTGIGGFEVEPEDPNERPATPRDATGSQVASVEPSSQPAAVDETIDRETQTPETIATSETMDEVSSQFERNLLTWLGGFLAVGLIFVIGSTLMLKRRTSAR
ncbi:MAG: hypothetical protein GY768_03725 [Planctomycetaceae bacterium]|nr:hypothetical protein [Planctomycetaceae bacterium]